MHGVFLPFFPPTTEQLVAENVTLTALEHSEHERYMEWSSKGNGYFVEQTFQVSRPFSNDGYEASMADFFMTQANTIGLALQDNPVGQLSWIGEEMIACE